MQNQAMLLVSDMGLEIPVPDIQWGNKESSLVPVFSEVKSSDTFDAREYSYTTNFQITRTNDGNYELDSIEHLREALEWFYSYKPNPRAPIISRMIDTSAIDISNAQIKSCTVNMNYGDMRTIDLELLI